MDEEPRDDFDSEANGERPPATEQERELARRLVELLSAGRKIEAVKVYREATGCSLSEAVAFVNGVAREHGLAQSSGCSTSAAAMLAIVVALAWLL